MSGTHIARPLARGLRRPVVSLAANHCGRYLSVSAIRLDSTLEPTPPSEPPPPPPAEIPVNPLDLDPHTAVRAQHEMALAKAGTPPIGSRRRRAALRTSMGLPFLEMPYQCFQEALKVIAEDREKKVAKIRETMGRIEKLEASDGTQFKRGLSAKERKLKALRSYVEELKILADINSPVVKQRFEDGLGDMNKPIYRHLANKRWRSFDYKILEQRIAQHKIVPDILPKFAPTAEVDLYFLRKKITPGLTVASHVSEHPPRLRVQVFDKGPRLVSVVAMDPDVPDAATDGYRKRCHFLASNIQLSPTETSLPFSHMSRDEENKLAVPWLPPAAQKGTGKHRIAIFVLEQRGGKTLDVAKLRELYAGRDGFSLKSFRDKFGLDPVGFNMFRSEWDENTAAVMERSAQPGGDVEFRRSRVYSLKPPRKARGWEAKRQGPKYKHLWNLTKRIRGLSNARGWTRKGH